jgi:cell cycle sensor histidine kinase DivJ
MIRGADGDRLGLPAIGAGTLLRDVLDVGHAALPGCWPPRRWRARQTHLVNGRKVAFCATPYEGGTHIVLIDRQSQAGKP